MSGECTYTGLTCFDYASTAWRVCTRCKDENGEATYKKRCAICLFEEQGPAACPCPKNIAAIRDARVQQLTRKHEVNRPAPARLPDDLREIWNDKAALKAGPRECPQAEPAAGHQAVPAARAAGAGCQPAAGAGCQPVAGARPHPAPVAAGPRPAPQAPPTVFGRSAAAPGSVDLLNPAPSEAADAAGTDVGCSLTSTSIVDGMQALRDGMGALEAALTAMAPTMATKDDMVALKTAMETGFDEMSKRLDDMEEKVQSLQHGWKVVPEGAAEGAAEDHEGEASGPVSAHSMDADSWRARYANEGETSEFQ